MALRPATGFPDLRARSREGLARIFRHDGESRLEWLGFEAGARSLRRPLARCDSHGRWIAWGAD